MKSFSLHFILGLAAASLTLPLAAEPVLLGNKDIGAQSLDADGIKAVLLGKKVTLGSTRVVIVIAKSNEAQESFLKEHAGMTTSQFQTHWRRLFMTGGGGAPKVVETEAEACKLVAETPGAVTIADSGSAGSLLVLGK